MLYIIYGLTASVGKYSRALFDELGIRQVKKINYEPEDLRVKPTYNPTYNLSNKEDVEGCDYVYDVHGRKVGFNSDQIEGAVNGCDDAILTFSSNELSFLREIKEAYGDHVATIYAYIDEQTLTEITNELYPSEDEKKHRLEMGKAIRERYIAERELFDETVIFGGENSVFDFANLRRQYEYVFKKYKEIEKDLVPLPYKGNKPYVFVSYARKNSDTIMPYLRFLQKQGCRMWYDRGIPGGDNWMSTLAMRIKGCTQFLLFSSQAATESLWTCREASRALKRPDIKIVTVRLDDARFDDGIEWPLEDYQQLSINDKDFEKRLFESICDEVIERIGD